MMKHKTDEQLQEDAIFAYEISIDKNYNRKNRLAWRVRCLLNQIELTERLLERAKAKCQS